MIYGNPFFIVVAPGLRLVATCFLNGIDIHSARINGQTFFLDFNEIDTSGQGDLSIY